MRMTYRGGGGVGGGRGGVVVGMRVVMIKSKHKEDNKGV